MWIGGNGVVTVGGAVRRVVVALALAVSSFVGVVAAPVPANAVSCTKTFVPVTGDWGVPGSWTPSGVPGATDWVCVAATQTVTLDIDTSVAGVTIDGTLALGGRTLTKTSATDPDTIAILSGAGRLAGVGAATLIGTTTWTGALSIADTRDVLNTGTVAMNGSRLDLVGTAKFRNSGSITTNVSALLFGPATTLLVNEATGSILARHGTAWFTAPFKNDGALATEGNGDVTVTMNSPYRGVSGFGGTFTIGAGDRMSSDLTDLGVLPPLAGTGSLVLGTSGPATATLNGSTDVSISLDRGTTLGGTNTITRTLTVINGGITGSTTLSPTGVLEAATFDLAIGATLHNNGLVRFATGGGFMKIRGQFENAGTLRISGSFNQRIDGAPTGLLTNLATGVIEKTAGSVPGALSTSGGALSLLNNGVVRAASATEDVKLLAQGLKLDPASTGSWDVGPGDTLEFASSTVTLNNLTGSPTGVVRIIDSSVVTFNGTTTIPIVMETATLLGTNTLSSLSVEQNFFLQQRISSLDGAGTTTIPVGGALTIPQDVTFVVGNGHQLVNQGTVHQVGGPVPLDNAENRSEVSLQSGGRVTNSGVWTFENPYAVFVTSDNSVGAAFTTTSTGRVEFQGTGDLTRLPGFSAPIAASGRFVWAGNRPICFGSIGGFPAPVCAPGPFDATGKTLEGTGTIAVTSLTKGTISPGGAGIGTMTITGNYTPNTVGVVQANIDGANADRLVVNGTATLGGTLALTVANLPATGSYTLLQAGTISGRFGSLTGIPASTPQVGWSIVYSATTVQLVGSGPPPAPTQLAAANSGANIVLTWQDNSVDEAQFDIQRARWNSTDWAEWTNFTAAANASTFTDLARPDGQYVYLVRSVNARGVSDWATVVFLRATATTLPAAPTGLTATKSGGNVVVHWTDNATNELGYDVMRARWVAGVWGEWTSWAADINATSFTDTTPPDAFYAYLVRSRNNRGNSAWTIGPIEFTTATAAPADPSNLQVVTEGADIRLTWTDNSTTEHLFDVERARYNATTHVWGEWVSWPVDKNGTTFTDVNVPDGQYAYLVRARNPIGASNWVITVHSHTTSANPPADPFGLAANVSGSTVNLSWTDNSLDEFGFDVQRAKLVAGVWGGWTSWTVDRNGQSFSDTGVTAGSYFYFVRAYNPNGVSAWVSLPATVA